MVCMEIPSFGLLMNISHYKLMFISCQAVSDRISLTRMETFLMMKTCRAAGSTHVSSPQALERLKEEQMP